MDAGDNLKEGSSNIILGYNIDAPTVNGDEQLVIGNLIYGTSIDGTGTTISSGNIGIGDSSPEAKLKVNGTVLATAFNGDGSALTGVVMSPGGSTTQIQYNNGGTLSGDANLSWDNALNKISVAGNGSFSTGIYLPSNIGIYRSSDVASNTYFSFPGEDKARITVGGMYGYIPPSSLIFQKGLLIAC